MPLSDYVAHHRLDGPALKLKKLADSDPEAVISSEKHDCRRLDTAFKSLPPEAQLKLRHHDQHNDSDENDDWDGDEIKWFATHPPPVPQTYHLVITSEGRKVLKEIGVRVEESKSTAQRSL